VSLATGARGPVMTHALACASSLYSIVEGYHFLQRGEADAIVAGGVEAALTLISIAAFGRMGAMATRTEDPPRACRPFSVDRDGLIFGEGAAALVLETEEHARARGATPLAEVLGGKLTGDAFHVTAPDPAGGGAARALCGALAAARLQPEDVDVVYAHGTGTPLNDVSETRAIHTVFGDWAGRIPISSHKGATGHTLGAAGALSTVVGVQAILERLVPPTVNLETPDPECDLDYVPGRARGVDLHAVLVNAIGFGGQNACLIVRRWAQGG